MICWAGPFSRGLPGSRAAGVFPSRMDFQAGLVFRTTSVFRKGKGIRKANAIRKAKAICKGRLFPLAKVFRVLKLFGKLHVSCWDHGAVGRKVWVARAKALVAWGRGGEEQGFGLGHR